MYCTAPLTKSSKKKRHYDGNEGTVQYKDKGPIKHFTVQITAKILYYAIIALLL